MPSWRWKTGAHQGVMLIAGRIPNRVQPALHLETGEILAYFRSAEAMKRFDEWMDDILVGMDAENWDSV